MPECEAACASAKPLVHSAANLSMAVEADADADADAPRDGHGMPEEKADDPKLAEYQEQLRGAVAEFDDVLAADIAADIDSDHPRAQRQRSRFRPDTPVGLGPLGPLTLLLSRA